MTILSSLILNALHTRPMTAAEIKAALPNKRFSDEQIATFIRGLLASERIRHSGIWVKVKGKQRARWRVNA